MTAVTELEVQGAAAKSAARILAGAGAEIKNRALENIALTIESHADEWLSANEIDVSAAEAVGMKASLIDRLRLTRARIDGVVAGIRQAQALPDPVGRVDGANTRPNGLVIAKRRVPLGVIAIIYEARPNVTVDAAVLCLKSGNSCILRGGKEAINSNKCVTELIRTALTESGLPADCVSLVQRTDRETAAELMHMDKYVDVLIPRGGAGLIRAVTKESTVPVIRTGEGVCHIYIDKNADLEMGAKILVNAKCSRPSVCNAAECVILHETCAEEFLLKAIPMLDEYNVRLKCDEASLRIVGDRGEQASDEDWDAEYGDYILAVRTVRDMDEAIEFINTHGTGHSEAIITNDYFAARMFTDEVDAAAVYVNASTRFTDGGEFGLGAEIGISTQKLHARGPMGLDELTTVKYVVLGDGQIR